MKVKIFIQSLEEGGQLWAMQTWKEARAGQSKQCWGGREAGTPGTIVSWSADSHLTASAQVQVQKE